MTKLKPPKNIKVIRTRCCFTCFEFQHNNDGTSQCNRPDGPEWDTGDMQYVLQVCDRWRWEAA